MMRSHAGAHKFDKDKWGTELAPILNLWKKLNQVCQFINLLLKFTSNIHQLPVEKRKKKIE